ncbi:alpha-1,4-glucan--maltose-1-phosphate maltosyltransferase [Altericroceibacterium xinjiangense]|uniref:alpha-1,4-glucan--maltose-1-phosphate maltosyltransferase n=1 Tax=Altericroceibacterium xinjiangense TaxID=762261 RepID=UPI000F7DCAF3|nr:alpha-1,4-glucan--maltose-1-phosphate maltosyltransferase [Altericroceibacterium xinjiangense]
MTNSAVRILSARFSGSDDPQLSDKALRQAREAGFDGLQCPVPSWLSEEEGRDLAALAQRCRAAELTLIAEVDLTRFPVDHPLVQSDPDAFAIRRSAQGPVPIDPRKDMPAAGEAIARLRTDRHADVLAGPLGERLHALVGRGVRGFRIVGAERIAPELLKPLIAQARSQEANLLFIAGPLGEDRTLAGALTDAGVDFLVSSFAWWDLRAPWFLDELDDLRGCGPVLGEIRGDQSSGEGARTRLAAASAVCSGVIAPIEFLSSDAIRDDAARAASGASEAQDYSGPLVRLSASSAPVTVLLRPNDADLRSAEHALIVMINQGSQAQPVPGPSDLSSAAGAFGDPQPLTPARDASAPLQPGEVRLLKVTRSQPVTHRPLSHGSFRDLPRLVIEDISPSVEGGDFPIKRVVGETVTVEATVFADGHEQLAAELRWRPVNEDQWSSARMTQLPNDRWRAEFPVERMGRHEFVVEGWLDRFGGFQRDFAKKWDAKVAQDVDHAEGRALVQEAAGRAQGQLRGALEDYLNQLTKAEGEDCARLLLDESLARLMADADDRRHALVSPRQLVDAERVEARFSSWYELFPRSITEDKARHGTFADVMGILPHVRDMGFDTLYFPPIHPIGKINRKGPNNTLTPGPDDPGSPYAIGSKDGGHDAIHPELGTFEDFGRLVEAAAEHGLEIALDFAIQAAPDHPWLNEHPGWFAWRPDGSMKYAENPPKKYQDIVNVDFYGPDAVPGLWEALRDVVLLWVDHGVKTFRVDNPHTKPLPFWEWMIAEVRARHPEVIFLSEAFTRPTMMYRLAKIGFSQSYTYFTWRDRKDELMEYITELTTTAPKEFYRPNFFVNTPDINPLYLQTSGRPGFRIRAVLAATLSGLWGVYSGFELCEFEPLGPGKEEYLDSEKFEIRPRPLRTPGDIVDDVTLLNRLRRAHPALQTHLNTRFYPAYDDNILWYGKPSPDGKEMIMVMVNLDPHNAHECDFEIPLWEFGVEDNGTVAVEDLAHGHRFEWSGKAQHIRLAPDEPYRIWRLSVPGGAA